MNALVLWPSLNDVTPLVEEGQGFCDKLNLVNTCLGWLRHEPIFVTAPAAVKSNYLFKSGQK